jgi:hypothetical protein
MMSAHDARQATLGRCGRISGGVLDCFDLFPAMDEFPCGVLALADRVGDDCVVPVTMPRFIGGVENAGEHTPVSQSNAHGFAEIGFNLLIGHTFEIAWESQGLRLYTSGSAPAKRFRTAP